ncbi:MAG: PilZ domain-containing protein [gamma proteobacterium symbiont of Taylorina sp.]|nr:PilZ domain-containing protein [gamma proteobacterium symbiont of Taylorina sp.]
MTINYDEQRSFYRMSVDCHVEFSESGSSEKYQGEGKNLSATGVNFITEHKLTEGQELDVVVHPVIKTVTPLSAKAKVVRVTEDEQTQKFIVGISLDEVN